MPVIDNKNSNNGIKHFLIPIKFAFSYKGIKQLFRELPDLLLLGFIFALIWGLLITFSI
ncbi:hypothetical protein [Legionella gresilensis]|uniref:hypothetical protein n=1 Tax=Legionella gresilensis TaxID=91823 RepID=UPI001A93B2E7|nr:hypothetical protein [Legionella gresilensis]